MQTNWLMNLACILKYKPATNATRGKIPEWDNQVGFSFKLLTAAQRRQSSLSFSGYVCKWLSVGSV